MTEENRLKDERRRSFYMIDNEILDTFGPTIGAYGVAVYNVIAKYADAHGEKAFPSYQTIADTISISRRKTIDVIELLVGQGLVKKSARKKASGDATSNLYTLVDVKDIPSAQHALSSVGGSAPHALPSAPHALPSAPHAPDVVQDMHPINTQLDQHPLTNGGEDARRSLPDIPFELPPPQKVADDDWLDPTPDQLQLQAEEQPKHRNGYVKEKPAPIPSSEPPLSPSKVPWERRKVVGPNAERVREAQGYGVDKRTLRTMTDVVLEACGKKALADAGDDWALNDAQDAVVLMMRMDERFRSVAGIESVVASWGSKDYRGHTPPTITQLKEQASRILAGKEDNKFPERSNERAKTTNPIQAIPGTSVGRAKKFEELSYEKQLNVLAVRGEIDDDEYERRLQAYNASIGAAALAKGAVPVSGAGLLRS